MEPWEQLDDLDVLARDLADRARRAGVRLFWRAQASHAAAVLVRGGRTESSSASSASGHGIQVVTDRGRTALATRDDFRGDEARAALDRAIAAAGAAGADALDPVEIADLEPARAREVPPASAACRAADLAAIARRLIDLEADLASHAPDVAWKLGFRAEVDAWRIGREDGTDVRFVLPRCTVTARAAAGDDGGRHGIGVALHLTEPGRLDDDDAVEPFRIRARRAADLVRALPDAPSHPAGSFPVVLDYALAKGLAHEAFGHAAEADGLRGSVLAVDGRFDAGREVGASHVTVIDEPVPDDHAWQPWSANGVRRERAVIVRDGRLETGLSDAFTAGANGGRSTGAARAASYRDAPLPRMTNIRIEVAGALPAPGRFEDHGPEEVRDLLASAGVFRRHREVAFLSGYGGGQVNTAIGDFVFHCKAIWGLAEDGVRLYRPAIFSGSMFGALHSIREAFGPLRLDALGWCGKWGQSVPSSGGSHWFLVLEPHDDVRLGGGA